MTRQHPGTPAADRVAHAAAPPEVWYIREPLPPRSSSPPTHACPRPPAGGGANGLWVARTRTSRPGPRVRDSSRLDAQAERCAGGLRGGDDRRFPRQARVRIRRETSCAPTLLVCGSPEDRPEG